MIEDRAGGRIQDLPNHERPRERLARLGPEALRDAELLAIVLRVGSKGRSALTLAEDLVTRYGSLAALAAASLDSLQKTAGIGRDKAVTLQAAFALARRMARELHEESTLLNDPASVADCIREELRHLEQERFLALPLDTRGRLIRIETVSAGSLDSAMAHPREVFRSAIAANAASLIVAHNHPSGDPSPSQADIRVTRNLAEAGALLRIPLRDHVIMGKATKTRPLDFVSMRELGCL